METNFLDKRKSGLPLIGDVPWGTSLGLFFQTPEDIPIILGPFFDAGLKNHEFCVWVTPQPPDDKNLKRLLGNAISDLDQCLARRQFEVVSNRGWGTTGRKTRQSILTSLDKAAALGCDGLRLACEFSVDDKRYLNPDSHGENETISRFNVITIFAYPRAKFDALKIMDVVKNHERALIRNDDRWEVIESAEARTARNTLIRSEEKLRALFSHMAEGFAYHRIVFEENGKPSDYIFLEVNKAFENMVGLAAEKIIGKKVTEVLPGIENDPADWIGQYGKVALTGKPVQFESYSAVLKKWFSVSAFSPSRGFFAVTFTDITERRQSEEALKQSNLALEAANKELEAFSYSVSHDLRAPLRALDGVSQAILEDYGEKLDDQGKEWLVHIRHSSQKMGELIDDLLDLSRVARTELRRQNIDLSELSREVAQELRAVQPERPVDLQITPGIQVFGDPNLLRIVLTNLIDNAIKFTAQCRRAVIELGVVNLDFQKYYFIKDNGVGFDMTYADKLFKPFQRLHRAEEYPGTGIGLATVQRIISRHGGTIHVESEPGKGATFYFSLGEEDEYRGRPVQPAAPLNKF